MIQKTQKPKIQKISTLSRPRLVLPLLIAAFMLTIMGWAILTPANPTAPPLPFADVEMVTSDGRTLYAALYDPTQKPESDEEEEAAPAAEEETPAPPSVRYPLVILLHGLNGGHKDWASLPAKLVKSGYAVLALDLRGHGQSTKLRGKSQLGWRKFDKLAWQQMPKDVDRWVKYFADGDGKDEYPQVNARGATLVGAKLGANAALIAAASNYELYSDPRQGVNRYKGLILISPSLDYKGLETSKPIVKYNGPLFIISSQTDEEAYKGAQLLYRWALGAKSIKLYKGAGDSTDMLRLNADIGNQIVAWIKKTPASKSSNPKPVAKPATKPGASKPIGPKATPAPHH